MKILARVSALLTLLTVASALVVTFVVAPIVYADSSGPNFAGTGADDSSVGQTIWAPTSSITASDNSYAAATCGTSSFTRTHYIKGTNFGFSIPGGSTINGIVAEFEAKVATTGLNEYYENVRLVKGGTIQGSNLGGDTSKVLTTSDAFTSFGSSSELWGLAWSTTDINATDFGAVANFIGNGAGTSTCSVDSIRITVHYTPGGGAAPDVQVRETQVIMWQ